MSGQQTEYETDADTNESGLQSSSPEAESCAWADSQYEYQWQKHRVLVDHDNEISVHKVQTGTGATGKPTVKGYILHEGGEKTWLNRDQAEALIDILEILFDA